ncbi:hypothetical protein ACVIGB_008489 [Bradyrhizobium sp. USDA 4341]
MSPCGKIAHFSDGANRHATAKALSPEHRWTVVSTMTNQPPMVADDLRRQVDEFIGLAKLKLKLGRVDRNGLASRQATIRSAQITNEDNLFMLIASLQSLWSG